MEFPNLTLEQAYEIQDEGVQLRTQAGEKIIGLKMGLTSKAKMEQMGLHTPIYGVLTDKMRVKNQGSFSLAGKIHPKIEPEIAFITSRELAGGLSIQEAAESCSGVCAAMEILDSRYVGFNYFSLPDVVADNSSSAFFVLGETIPLKGPVLDQLDNLEMTLEVNGKVAQAARSNVILGHPLQSLIHLCEILQSRGRVLPKGSIVLAGAATQAVKLEPGMDVRLRVSHLGTVTVAVVA